MMRLRRTAAMLATTALAAVAAAALPSGASATSVIYSNLPSPLPGNFASFGNEAYSDSEFGGMVTFAGLARESPVITVAMSSWACQYGTWSEKTCETPFPKKKFKWPITLNIYEVGPGNSVGAKLLSVTKTFKMPYRPTRTVECASKGSDSGAWFDAAANTCYHGLAFPITFKLKKATLPATAIISVSYNTSHHGPSPVGTQSCSGTVAGCYYDSLNVAIAEPAEHTLTVGSDPTKSLYLNSTYEAMYCGSSTPVGTFGPTAPIEGSCATGSPYETEENIQPVFSVTAK